MGHHGNANLMMVGPPGTAVRRESLTGGSASRGAMLLRAVSCPWLPQVFLSLLPVFHEVSCLATPSPDALSYLGPKAMEPIESDLKRMRL